MNILSDELLEKIQYEMEGTSISLSQIIESHDLDVDENALEEKLLDGPHPIERSKCCEWWFEVCNLEFDEEVSGGVCQSCEPDMFD